MQAFYLLSKSCSRALYCWHLLWQISVTTKGYTVNTRWQILKLACFHNCHFLRGEQPFSASLKTSGFQPAQHPRTSSHNHLLWKCHYSILKRLEQLCFFCNNYVFLKRRKKSNESQGQKSFHGSVMLPMYTGENKVENTVSNPMSKAEPPFLCSFVLIQDWKKCLAAHPQRVHPAALYLMNHLIQGAETIHPIQHPAINSLSWNLLVENLW